MAVARENLQPRNEVLKPFWLAYWDWNFSV